MRFDRNKKRNHNINSYTVYEYNCEYTHKKYLIQIDKNVKNRTETCKSIFEKA